MDRWNGKVAVVTGASAGLGLATTKLLISEGLTVVGMARRKTVMEDAMKNVKGPGKFYARECDITQEKSVSDAFDWIKSTVGTVNILINNAGAIKHKKIVESTTEETDRIIDVNLKGLLYCTKKAVKLMNENKKEAHIINVNSVLGHIVPPATTISFDIYPATKFAVTALSETLRNELRGTPIRVTSVSPGLAKTDMMDQAVKADSKYSNFAALESEDVADAILYVLKVPQRVEINELTLQAKHE